MRYAVKSAPAPAGDPNEFVMSDSQVDRMGDVIEAKGWQLKHFKEHPIALFNHDRDQVIGKWRDVRIEGNQLRGHLELAKAGTSPIVDTVRALHDQGILRAVSVGFAAVEKEPLTKEADEYFGPFRFTKSELLECSLVAVPANPRALAVAKSLGTPSDLLSEVFRKSAKDDTAAAHHAKPGKPTSNVSRTPNMHGQLSQRLKAAHDNYNLLRDRLLEITNMEEPSDDDIQRADELSRDGGEIDQAKAQIIRLQAQERALAPLGDRSDQAPVTLDLKATEVKTSGEPSPAAPRAPFALPRKKSDPGDLMYRALACWAASEGSKEPLTNIIRDKLSGSDREAIPHIIRAAANPALTTVAGWAQELTSSVNVGFLDRLLPTNIYSSLAAAGNRYTFDSYYQIKIPVRTTTSQLAGAWVGEGAPKPVKKGSFTLITLTPFKLAVISTFSEEMAQYSMPTIEGIIRQAMQDDTAITLDSFLIDNVAASATRPAGLLNGVTPITASVASTQAQKIIDDMSALYAAIVAAGGGSNVVYLMNPAQAIKLGTAVAANGVFMFNDANAAASKFNGRVIASATVAAGRVIAVDAAEFATATGDQPRFAISNEATLHEEDTTPLALSATGTPNTVAAPMRSLFQTDAIAIRMTLYVTWAMRRTGMVQTIASVTW